MACAGGEPLGLTDCLNFGSPEKPEIAWELAQAIEGHRPGLPQELGIPVVSGNVSLYNETGGGSIPPTPVVGCVGLVARRDADSGRWRPATGRLLRGEGAELVGFVWQHAHLSRSPTTSRAAASRRRYGGAGLVEGTQRPRKLRSGGVVVARRRHERPAWDNSSSWGPSDVRRLRRPGAGPGRRAAHLLRPARAPAPRPGVGRNRGQRGRPPDRATRPRARRAGVRRAEPVRTARRARDRPHALLDDRRQRWENAQPLLHHGRARTVALGTTATSSMRRS